MLCSAPFYAALTRAAEQRTGADLRCGAAKPRLHFGRSARGPVIPEQRNNREEEWLTSLKKIRTQYMRIHLQNPE
jgi:hypothetical protein